MLDIVEVKKRGRPRKELPGEFLCKSKAERLSGSQENALRLLYKDANRNQKEPLAPKEWQAILHSEVLVECDDNGNSFLNCGHRIPQAGSTPFRWCSACYRHRMRRVFSWKH